MLSLLSRILSRLNPLLKFISALWTSLSVLPSHSWWKLFPRSSTRPEVRRGWKSLSQCPLVNSLFSSWPKHWQSSLKLPSLEPCTGVCISIYPPRLSKIHEKDMMAKVFPLGKLWGYILFVEWINESSALCHCHFAAISVPLQRPSAS